MPSDDASVILAAYGGWNEQGAQALAAYSTDDVVLKDMPDLPDAKGALVGKDVVTATWEERRKMAEIEIEPIELSESPSGRFLLEIHVKIGTEGSPTFEEPHFHVIEMSDGKIARVSIFRELAQAQKEAGIESGS